MNFGRQLVGYTLGLAFLLSVGCTKKNPQLPQQAKNPPDTVEVPLPYEISETTTPPPPAPEPQVEAPVPEQPKQPPPKHRKKKPVPTTAITAANPAAPAPSPGAASTGNTTVAVAHAPANPAAEPPPPSPPDTAIAAGVSNAQLSQQKQTTTQMLEATEKTLGGLNRSLSHDEEEMVAQVRSYIAQSRKATTDGDFERAYNLATKAHLLSDALVKK